MDRWQGRSSWSEAYNGIEAKLPHRLLFETWGKPPMAGYILEVTAKVIIRSNTDPDELPADIYAHISEFIHQDDDILDLDVEVFALPADLSGGSSN